MAGARRTPTVERRVRRLVDGTETEHFSVRYFAADGSRRRITCATREQAEVERARVVYELLLAATSAPVEPAPVAEPEPEEKAGLTVEAFWSVWRNDARGRLARSTLKGYDGHWERRVRPRFGAMALDAVTPRMISQWRSDLLADGVGAEVVRYAMVTLQAMYTVAIEWGEAQTNPVSVVRKPRQGRQRAVAPIAPEGVEQLRSELLADGDERSAVLVSVMAYAGLRPGEALALEARHIRQSTILVEQAVTDGELKRQKTGRLYRTVDLLPVLAGDLADWMAAGRDGFLFARADGGPWRTDDWKNWRNRRFLPAAKRAGLGRPRPYDLRHSFVSLMVREQRTSVVELADQLGHAPTMTLNTYAHVFAEFRRTEPVDANEWIVRARRGIADRRV
jgi:integrase